VEWGITDRGSWLHLNGAEHAIRDDLPLPFSNAIHKRSSGAATASANARYAGRSSRGRDLGPINFCEPTSHELAAAATTTVSSVERRPSRAVHCERSIATHGDTALATLPPLDFVAEPPPPWPVLGLP